MLSEKYDIIIQGGQSNAEGCGLGPVTKEYTPCDKIFVLEAEKEVYVDGDKGAAVRYLEKPFPIKMAQERMIGKNIIGDFSLTFARSYLEKGYLSKDRKLLIIRAAIGGTGFYKKHWGVQDKLYLKMLEMTDYALSLNPDNKVVACLWHQGEHDAFEGNLPENYHQQFSDMLAALRDKYGDIPFIAGDFVNEWKQQNIKICEPIVNEIKKVISKTKNARFVETFDLLSNNQEIGNGDPIHFSRESLHKLGERYFDALISIWDIEKLII